MHGICCTFYPQSANQCIALCRSYPVVSKNTNGRRICRRFVKQKPCLFHKLVSIQHFPLRWLSFASWFNTLCREMIFTKFHSKSSSYHKHHTVLKHRLPFASVIPFFVSEHWTALSSRCCGNASVLWLARIAPYIILGTDDVKTSKEPFLFLRCHHPTNHQPPPNCPAKV